MMIDVVGGGSIGLLMSARLAKVGYQVNLWTRTREQAEQINKHGLRLLSRDGAVASEALFAAAGCLSDVQPNQGIFEHERSIFLCVKQTQLTDELVQSLQHLVHCRNGSQVSVIAMQNGFGHLQWLAKALPDCQIYAAITTEGARKIDYHTVQHTGLGEVWMSEYAEYTSQLREYSRDSQILLVNMLQKAGISAYLSNDMYNRMLQKLLINAVINPLTAIYDVPNGELLSGGNRVALMKSLYEETNTILKRSGMKLENKDGWEMVVQVCKLTASNISSMLSDVRAGRTTEITAINGAVMELARSAGLEAPVNAAVSVLVQSLLLRRE